LAPLPATPEVQGTAVHTDRWKSAAYKLLPKPSSISAGPMEEAQLTLANPTRPRRSRKSTLPRELGI
jgi:hypothetical protein